MSVAIKNLVQSEKIVPTVSLTRKYSSQKIETDEEFDARWEHFFKKFDLKKFYFFSSLNFFFY